MSHPTIVLAEAEESDEVRKQRAIDCLIESFSDVSKDMANPDRHIFERLPLDQIDFLIKLSNNVSESGNRLEYNMSGKDDCFVIHPTDLSFDFRFSTYPSGLSFPDDIKIQLLIIENALPSGIQLSGSVTDLRLFQSEPLPQGITFEHLKNLRVLDMHYLTSLPSGLGLSKLTQLTDLSLGHVRTFPDDVDFSELTELKFLIISSADRIPPLPPQGDHVLTVFTSNELKSSLPSEFEHTYIFDSYYCSSRPALSNEAGSGEVRSTVEAPSPTDNLTSTLSRLANPAPSPASPSSPEAPAQPESPAGVASPTPASAETIVSAEAGESEEEKKRKAIDRLINSFSDKEKQFANKVRNRFEQLPLEHIIFLQELSRQVSSGDDTLKYGFQLGSDHFAFDEIDNSLTICLSSYPPNLPFPDNIAISSLFIITKLPEGIRLPSSITRLHLGQKDPLSLDFSFTHLKRLQFLSMGSLTSIPSGLGISELIQLHELDLGHVISLPEDINLSRLQDLRKLNIFSANRIPLLPPQGSCALEVTIPNRLAKDLPEGFILTNDYGSISTYTRPPLSSEAESGGGGMATVDHPQAVVNATIIPSSIILPATPPFSQQRSEASTSNTSVQISDEDISTPDPSKPYTRTEPMDEEQYARYQAVDQAIRQDRLDIESRLSHLSGKAKQIYISAEKKALIVDDAWLVQRQGTVLHGDTSNQRPDNTLITVSKEYPNRVIKKGKKRNCPHEGPVIQTLRQILVDRDLDTEVLPIVYGYGITSSGNRFIEMEKMEGSPLLYSGFKKQEVRDRWKNVDDGASKLARFYIKALDTLSTMFPVFEAEGFAPALDLHLDEIFFTDDGKMKLVDFDVYLNIGNDQEQYNKYTKDMYKNITNGFFGSIIEYRNIIPSYFDILQSDDETYKTIMRHFILFSGGMINLEERTSLLSSVKAISELPKGESATQTHARVKEIIRKQQSEVGQVVMSPQTVGTDFSPIKEIPHQLHNVLKEIGITSYALLGDAKYAPILGQIRSGRYSINSLDVDVIQQQARNLSTK